MGRVAGVSANFCLRGPCAVENSGVSAFFFLPGQGVVDDAGMSALTALCFLQGPCVVDDAGRRTAAGTPVAARQEAGRFMSRRAG